MPIIEVFVFKIYLWVFPVFPRVLALGDFWIAICSRRKPCDAYSEEACPPMLKLVTVEKVRKKDIMRRS